MDNVYVVVVKDAAAAEPMSDNLAMSFPQELGSSRRYRVAVWRSIERTSQERWTRDKMLGMAAMLGISVASWTGVAVLISHLVH